MGRRRSTFIDPIRYFVALPVLGIVALVLFAAVCVLSAVLIGRVS